jgi:hypothetical protein
MIIQLLNKPDFYQFETNLNDENFIYLSNVGQ